MSTPLLAYANRIDAATLGGGSWSQPIANIKDPRLANYARSTNATLASTLFTVDLAASYSLRAVALVKHTLSTAALVRVRTSNVSAAAAIASPNYNSGWFAAKRMTFHGNTPADWGDQYHALDVFAAVTARYLYIEIDDTTNGAGFIDIGRVFIGSGFQPAKGPSFGLANGRTDLSGKTVTPDGVEFDTERRRQRSVKFALNWLTVAEADHIDEMQAEIGTVDEVLYVPDPADLAHSQRRGFLGKMSALDEIGWPQPLTNAVPFQIKEKL